MPLGCKIIRDFKRPSPELVERFARLPVANIDDNMERMAAVDSEIRPLGRGKLAGTAFTVRVPAGDNLMFHASLDLAKPGDVIVIDAGGYKDRAILGEIMAFYCRERGIRGIVCDGAVRDRDTLAEMDDFPVYARAISPNGPYKNGPGEINTPVVIGGKVVHPGDIVVGDADGLVFVSPENAEAVVEAAEKQNRVEAENIELILTKCSFERPWVAKKLEAIGCEIV